MCPLPVSGQEPRTHFSDTVADSSQTFRERCHVFNCVVPVLTKDGVDECGRVRNRL